MYKTMKKGSPDFGGPDPSRWRPEAILANAALEELNRFWSWADVGEVVVAAPVDLQDSGYHPYGDGQSNARIELPRFTGKPLPPIIASLVTFSNSSKSVVIRIAAPIASGATGVEIKGKSEKGEQTLKLEGVLHDGDIMVEWRLESDFAIEQLGVVTLRPFPNYHDWFPLTFRHPVKTQSEMIDSIYPEASRVFPDGKSILDSERIKAQSQGNSPFQTLLGHSFPEPRWNNKPYIPEPIHGNFGSASGQATAVGKGWTWVAEKGHDAPFKVLYTCFDARQDAQEAQFGVPSGGGWHRIGDPAETIFNSLENVPILVGTGFENPAIGQVDSFSFHLSDVVTIRWLNPGEALVTARPDFHWFAFQFPRPVCTEEWVHPCVPSKNNPDFRCAS